MKKILFYSMLAISVCNLSAQNKKEQIQNLNISMDSLKQEILNERTTHKQEAQLRDAQIKTLKDKFERLKHSKDSLFTQLNDAKEAKLFQSQEVTKLNQSLDILKQQALELRKITAINPFRNSSNFEHFLSYFISNVYTSRNIDSLIYNTSPIISDLIDPNIGFGRFYNLGAPCKLYKSDGFGYHSDGEGFFGEKEPDIVNLPFFKNQNPDDGFCEESSSPNGVYFSQVNDLIEDMDMETGDYIPAPTKLKYLKKIRVLVQFDKWVTKTFYFVESNNKWFLLYIDDCDCSA